MSFAQFFGLADERRETFVVSPERDPGLLVDLDKLVPFLETRFEQKGSAPQAILYGEFGTGKTHALRYVEHVLGPKYAQQPIYFMLSNFGPKSTFSDVHLRVMNALDPYLPKILAALPDAETAINDNKRLTEDMKAALRYLKTPNLSPEQRGTIRIWMMGAGPTPSQARKLGFAGRLLETSGPVELVNFWKGIGELWAKATGKRLLLLIDEGEAFQKVTDSQAQASIGTGMRELFETDNAAVGIFLAANTPDARKGIHPLQRADLQSRLVGKTLTLTGLADPKHIEHFIQGWWQKIGRQDGTLLEARAVELIGQRLKEMRDKLSVRQQVASKPTQRNLMDVLAFIGQQAMTHGRRPPITEQDLRAWFFLS